MAEREEPLNMGFTLRVPPGKRRCWRCDGEGCTFAVYGQLDTYEKCHVCDGTGLVTQAEPDSGEANIQEKTA